MCMFDPFLNLTLTHPIVINSFLHLFTTLAKTCTRNFQTESAITARANEKGQRNKRINNYTIIILHRMTGGDKQLATEAERKKDREKQMTDVKE